MFAFAIAVFRMIQAYLIVDAYITIGKWLWDSYGKNLWEKWYYRPIGVRKVQ